MDEKRILHICLSKIENKLMWGNSQSWTNSEFTKLSDLISKKSGISISVSSLRRLYGKSKTSGESYWPQIETRNALCIFIGYSNWAEFSADISKDNSSGGKKGRNLKYFSLIAATIIILVLTLIVGKFILKPGYDADKIVFKGNYTQGTKVPHTVTIEYNLNDYKGPFYIDWSDIPQDGSELEKPMEISSNQGTLSHTYYTSNYYKIKLLDSKQKRVKTVRTFIATQGWECYVLQDEILLKLDSSDFVTTNTFYANNESIQNKGIDLHKPYRVFYRNLNNLGLIADDFGFSVLLTPFFREGYVECDHVQIEFIGENGSHMLTLMNDGCAGNIKHIRFSDLIINGGTTDLSAFSLINKKEHELRLQIRKKQVKLYKDDQEIFAGSYSKDIGALLGVRMEAKGNLKVSDLVLK